MKKFVNLRTALFVAFSLCVGILFSYSIFCGAIFYALFIGIVFFSLVSIYLVLCIKDGKKLKGLILSSIFIFVSIVGGVSFSVRVENYQSADLGNHYENITGKVVECTLGENYQRLILDNLCISSDEVNSRYKLSLYVYGDSDFDIGDIISFNGVIIDKSTYYNGRFSANSIEEGIKYSAKCEDYECTLLRNEKTIFEQVNVFIRETCEKGLDEKEFPVVYALLTGNSNYMEDELLTNFRASGVAHIFAVSGLHIGVLATALAFILNKLKCKKIISFLIMTFCLFFYSGICGFSASSIRASIMCSVGLLATIFGQRPDGISSMGIALFIVLIISPLQIFLVGFQLSFGVTFAILVLSIPLMKLLKFLPKKVAYALATVFSAQISSIPIMLIHFGAVSLCSVVVNLLMLPIVSVVFIFAIVSVLISGIFLLQQILLPLNYIIKAIIFLMEIFDFTVFMVGGISLSISVLFYYLALYVFGGMLNLSRLAKSLTISLLIVCFVGVQLGSDVYEHNSFKIYSVTDKNLYVSILQYQDESVMVVSKADGNININSLKIMCDDNHIRSVKDVVILESKEKIDIQRFATCVSLVLQMENIFYYGQKDEKLENMMQKSFPSITLYNYTDNGLDQINIEGRVLLGGYGVEFGYDNKKASFFSSIDESKINLENLWGEVQFSVGVNFIENIYSRVKAEEKYSYTIGSGVKSIENYGNIKYYLK